MCRKLLDSGLTHGVHLYTLNLEKSALAILERLGLIDTSRVPRVGGAGGGGPLRAGVCVLACVCVYVKGRQGRRSC